MKIYNLFPLLAGTPDRWRVHALRARSLGFDWIYLNPFQAACQSSGSLYSIRDPFALHRALDPDGSGSLAPVAAFVRFCHAHGLKVMMDLVLTRVALDSPLVVEHPEWFALAADGRPAPPAVVTGGRVVKVWEDQAGIAVADGDVAAGLVAWWKTLVGHFADLGFDGFKFERPENVPPARFRELIACARDRNPGLVLVAETLGIPPEATQAIAELGFDCVFNSSKYWDFKDDWALEQSERTRMLRPSVSFPETHDTNRLIADVNGDVRLVKQRLVFESFFSASLLVPIGFEFGFRRKLDAVTTTPADWEGVHVDLTSFLRRVNNIKSSYGVLSGEGRVRRISAPGDPVVQLLKTAGGDGESALLLMNTDPWTYHPVVIDDLKATMATDTLVIDVSPEYPVDGIQNHYQYYLKPTQTKVFYTPGPTPPDALPDPPRP